MAESRERVVPVTVACFRRSRLLPAEKVGMLQGGFSVRCDTQNCLLVGGFLIERGVHADACGRAAGVPVGRRVAARGQGAAGGSGGAGCAVVRSRAAVADRRALAAGVPGYGPVGVDRGTADDRDGDLYPVDGAQGAVSVGVSDVGGGGVGLDSSAAVLSDLTVGAGAGRVDGAQAHAPDWRRDGVRTHARDDREGDQGEAVSPAGDADRLDGDRGRRALPDGTGLASSGVRVLAREGRKLARLVKDKTARVRDRSRSMGRRLRAITRTIRRRSGEAKAEVLALTEQTGELLGQSITRGAAAGRGRPTHGARARRAGEAHGGGRAGGAGRSVREGRRADQAAGAPARRSPTGSCRCSTPTPGRSARASSASPTEFGYVDPDRRGHREHPARRARVRSCRPRTELGQPGRGHAVARHRRTSWHRLGISPREVALDGGFTTGRDQPRARGPEPEQTFIAGRQEPGSRRTQRRLRALPHRHRGPHQPPQTPLRAAPHAA